MGDATVGKTHLLSRYVKSKLPKAILVLFVFGLMLTKMAVAREGGLHGNLHDDVSDGGRDEDHDDEDVLINAKPP